MIESMNSIVFSPNMSPREVIQAGAFGGSYFGIKIDESEDDYEDLFNSLFKGLNTRLYLGVKYSPKLNKYGLKSGMDYKYWKDMKWMRSQDPRGWFQWYCNYYLGRRSIDDERQIQRWNDFCGMNGRWKNNLYSKIHKTGDWNISPRIQQSLLHWGYKANEQDYQLWLESNIGRTYSPSTNLFRIKVV